MGRVDRCRRRIAASPRRARDRCRRTSRRAFVGLRATRRLPSSIALSGLREGAFLVLGAQVMMIVTHTYLVELSDGQGIDKVRLVGKI